MHPRRHAEEAGGGRSRLAVAHSGQIPAAPRLPRDGSWGSVWMWGAVFVLAGAVIAVAIAAVPAHGSRRLQRHMRTLTAAGGSHDRADPHWTGFDSAALDV